MRHFLVASLIALTAGLAAHEASAQRFSPVMNPNNHEGKYSTGGFGASLGYAVAGGDSFRREAPSSEVIGGTPQAVFKRRNAQNRTRTLFGLDLDFQVGSNNSIVGTDFSIEVYNMQIGSTASRFFDNDAYEGIAENVSLIFTGFRFSIEFFSSEFLEADGRRTRSDFGLMLVVGPKAGFMFGGFGDLNGLASMGLDIGIMADVPLPLPGAEDLLSISPFLQFEFNYRLPVDGGLVDNTAGSPTRGKQVINDNFDIGFYNQTTDVNGDGVPDFDGIAVRRDDFIPAFMANIGFDFNITPIFISRTGTLINNWRFKVSLIASVPVGVNIMFARYPGDAMWSGGEVPMTATLAFSVGYFF